MALDLKALGPEELASLAAKLEKRVELEKARNFIDSLYPDEGPLRRELYPKQLQFFEAGKIHRERLMCAGNKVGKTVAGAYEVSLHLTGLYPHWWNGRRFDHPTRWWVAGKTNETTRDIIQKKLFGEVQQGNRKSVSGTGMIPHRLLGEMAWKQGVTDLLDHCNVKHVSGGWSVVGIKAYQQERGSFEGTDQHGIWCIAEGQRVVMADGRYIPIQDVRKGDFVLSTNGHGVPTARRVSAVHDNGIKSVVETRLTRGPWLRSTPDHKVFTTTYTKTPVESAVRILRAPKWQPIKTVDLTDAHYAWCGLALSEGTIKARKITMTDGVPIRKAIAMLPDVARVRKKIFQERHHHVPDWFLYWDDFWKVMPLGRSHEKEIPEWVFVSSNEKIALFVSYLWAGDGWFHGHNAGYASTSRLMTEQLSVLLWRLGIRSTVSFRKSNNTNWKDQWWVLVCSAEAVLQFFKSIDPLGKKEASEKLVVEATRRIESKSKRGRRKFAGSPSHRSSRAQSERYAAVVSVEPSGDARVYDLTVEDTHRYCVGLSMVSNCDEEPPMDIYGECLMRTMTVNGIILMTFTPLEGWSEVVLSFFRSAGLAPQEGELSSASG